MSRSVFRSHAPLRLGLAGGGTDTSPYADRHGGAVLNATLNLYAHATLEPTEDGVIRLDSVDTGRQAEFPADQPVPLAGPLPLLQGICRRLLDRHGAPTRGFRLTTAVDAPPGSGLGSSSTLVVAAIGAFAEWLRLPLGEYDLARLAYEIERVDLGMAGGRQDQYAATFGGVNFMEFYAGEKVVVNPLRVRREVLHELSHNLLLYFTETSRISSAIIERQTRNVSAGSEASLRGMDRLKEQAVRMKEALLLGELDRVGEIFDFGWQAKKELAEGVTNPQLDALYAAALAAGATGGKVSGAGGGGFMVLYCPGVARHRVKRAILARFGGRFQDYQFTDQGQFAWSIRTDTPCRD
jgi:D-glycero-alpha-D-manno-heptose-7-phosphate kinase